MTTKNTTHTRKAGELRSFKEEVAGPVKVYLDSGRRDADGELIMEEFTRPDGTKETRPEQDTEPFLEKVYYRKNYMTPKMERRLKDMRDSLKDLPLNSSVQTLVMMVSSWDLKNDGKPIPLTVEAIEEADVPSDIIYSTIAACYEHNRPPKTLTDRLPNTSSQEA